MHSNRALRVLVMFVVMALVGVTFVAAAPSARADANAPRWTSGDFWLYVDSSNRNHTLREEIVARENAQTLLGATYEAWHFRETETVGSVSLTTDAWIRDADLGVVRTSVTIGTTTITTYDPPQAQASFPLYPLKTWQVTVTRAVRIGTFEPPPVNITISYQVEAELDVSVPAGRFHSFSIRTLGTGAFTKLYYSDGAGYWSKRETYDSSNPPQKTGEMDLVQYRYQWNDWILAAIVAAISAVAVLVLAFLYKKRRQAVGRPGGIIAPGMGMQPPYGSQMPPQQPPTGPPPQTPP